HSTSSGSRDFFWIKILLISFSCLPVVVVGCILQPVIESALMVFLVLVDVLNERHNLVEIRRLVPLGQIYFQIGWNLSDDVHAFHTILNPGFDQRILIPLTQGITSL